MFNKYFYKGGELLAKETIEAVRLSELNAAQKEKEAEQEKGRILSEAKQSASALIASTTKDAIAKAQRDVQEAIRQGNDTIEIAKQNAEKEALLLKELAKEKEQDAISMILSSIV
jgi:V/A-type H+-transporting ATPase subunit G/H